MPRAMQAAKLKQNYMSADGRERLTMRDGCRGFAALNSGDTKSHERRERSRANYNREIQNAIIIPITAIFFKG